MAVQLIINADDFGLSDAVNAAVLRAHRDGVLTSASLMVTGPAAREAIEIARDLPGLAIGLHLALTEVAPALPLDAVPALVGPDGRFSRSPARAGFRWFVSSEARRQLRREIEAQFAAFAAAGLALSHVDGHQHLHAHPAVAPVVVEMATRCGASGIRVPHEPLRPSLAACRSRVPSGVFYSLMHGYLSGVCRKRIADTGLITSDICIGGLMSGAMTDNYVIRMLDRATCDSAEVFFHPSEDDAVVRLGPNRGDLEALLSARLRRFIDERGFRLTTYPELAQDRRRRVGSR